MKYKVGDNFLLEVEIVAVDERRLNNSPYLMKNPLLVPFWSDDTGIETICLQNDMTAEEAWEIARKIVLKMRNDGYGREELREVFGTSDIMTIFEDNKDPKQVKVKIKEWEEKVGIKIGDVVKTRGSEAIVLDKKGCIEEWSRDEVEKTGKHIVEYKLADGRTFHFSDFIEFLEKRGCSLIDDI